MSALTQRSSSDDDLRTRYSACMVLGAAGDALAYRNGDWEFLRDGVMIHNELKNLGGLEAYSQQNLIVSDDTVMHIATAKGMVDAVNPNDLESVFIGIAKEYQNCLNDMNGRAPGITCIRGARALEPTKPKGYVIPYDRAGGGCGGAMRSMCVGLRYPRPDQLGDLVAVAIESGRMTHNHPTGYLGSLVSALFTSYAIRRVPVKQWGYLLMSSGLPEAMKYVERAGRDVAEAKRDWEYFRHAWEKYLEKRKISDGKSDPLFPEPFGVKERDQFYSSISWDGWGGSSGHDAPMIAYDALLGCKENWKELTMRGFFHGGDSDSTAIIAACWYGAYYGFKDVFEINYKSVEKMEELVTLALKLYELAYPGP